MSVELLDKTRYINRLLQEKSDSNRVIFNDLCSILSEELDSNILVISKKGKILGISNIPGQQVINSLLSDKVGCLIDSNLNKRLSNILSTKENVNLETLGFDRMEVKDVTAIVTPIMISGERLGHLFIYRNGVTYSIEDIIISEYGATVVGLETMRSEKEEVDLENTKKSTVKSAIDSLSCSELEAIKCIMNELEGGEGILVASRIADQIGITRSIIVNSLRKFESAGIIKTRSSGMKGTYIKVINEYVYEFLENL
ncbi:MAG: GTP-sensing pleiotropic transcriptional regulator CodY [Lachnospiraceae bacterium]|nr:GTP-sensing pleiotropic transcriptional regulator CodY [Lachnospiraceae bacterium]